MVSIYSMTEGVERGLFEIVYQSADDLQNQRISDRDFCFSR